MADIDSSAMSFKALLQEIHLRGVRLRIADGQLQAAGLSESPALRAAIKAHRARLTWHVRCQTARLERPRIRWAHPPWTGNFFAWTEGAEREPIPVGLERVTLP
jgi:hypothetical protein